MSRTGRQAVACVGGKEAWLGGWLLIGFQRPVNRTGSPQVHGVEGRRRRRKGVGTGEETEPVLTLREKDTGQDSSVGSV